MRNLKAIMGCCFLFSTLIGCQDEVNRKFSPIEVTVNDSNEIAISDSIYFILPDTLPNKVTVISDEAGANLFYSINNGGFTMGLMDAITLHRNDSLFQFYLSKEGFDDSEIKSIAFQRHSKEFLNQIEVNSQISNSDLSLELDDKSRGMLNVEIVSMTGRRLLQRTHFKNTDRFIIEYTLADDLSTGIYIASVTFGLEKKAFKLIKE
jgi:hypothetical protein